jgi:zinc protease
MKALRLSPMKLSVLLVITGILVMVSSARAAEPANAPQKKSLDNGLAVIYQKDTASAVTVLNFLISGGQKAEPAGLDGLAYIATRLAIEIPDRDKVQELMVKASRYSLASKGDYSMIQIECLSENLEDTLKIFAEIMMDPLFSGLRVNYVKENMTHLQKIQSDDSVNVGHLAQLEALFGKAGYGRSFCGTEESLKKMKGKDIENFYKEHFLADRMVCAVVSDLELERVLNILKKYYAKLPSRGVASAPDSPSQAGSQGASKEAYIEKETKQCLVSCAFPLPPTSTKYFVMNYLLENLLGKGPGSRLWGLRSQEKLAYNVNAQASQMKDGGILEAYLETDAAKRDSASKALDKILTDLFEKGLTEEELQIAKVSAKAQFLRLNETKDKRASTLAIFEALGLGFDFFTKFPQDVENVTLAEMNAHIKNILPREKASLVIVGPKR